MSVTTDDMASLLESTANMLRGMTMDPAIPAHAKAAMRERSKTLDAAVSSYLASLEEPAPRQEEGR